MVKRTILLLGAALAIVPATARSSTPEITADFVIARTTEAAGGTAALRRLQNVRLIAEWTEGGTGFRGDYRATRDGRMRIDVYVDGNRVFSEGLDRTGAWEQQGPAGSVTDVGDAPRNALLHGVAYRFDGIWFARENGRRVTLEGREIIDGVNYHVVKLAFPDGFETHFYINPGTWLIERQRDHRAYHPSTDPRQITVESVRDEFGALCGVQFARASHDVNLGTGAVLARRRVTESSCNVGEVELDIGRPASADS